MDQGITLYHANWCGHCKQFQPVWEAMKKEYGDKGIKFESYEQTENPDIMKQNKIESFPTIQFKYGDYGAEYVGVRNPDEIMDQYTMFKEMTKDMKGGANNEYKQKYLKYKAKYLKAKEKIKKLKN